MRNKLAVIFLLVTVFSFGQDKGKGLLFFDSNSKEKVEINIYKSKNYKSKVLGVLTYQNIEDGQTIMKVDDKRLFDENFIEYAYEKSGIPLCSISDNWIELIYGFDKEGKKLIGWVEYKKNITHYLLWSEYLKSQLLFFEFPEKINLYNEINGKELIFKLNPSPYLKYDYIMKPLEVKGKWMKVELTTPNDSCEDYEIKRKGIFWIKYLNNKCRPIVWYFTRGC